MLITTTALAVIGFYLVIASNFLKELVGCHLQEVLNKNMFAKHLLGFLLLVILVVAFNPINSNLKIIQILLLAVVVYLWFIITTRSHYSFTVMTLIALLIVHILESSKSKYTSPKDDKQIKLVERIQLSLIVTAMVINIVGFTIYAIEKKREYGDSFKFVEFVVGKPQCKNFTPNSAKLIRDY